MARFEYTDTFDFAAPAVFAQPTDLNARPTWIEGILEVRVTPPGPARLATSYFESGKFSGFKSEKTLEVTEFEQDRLLTLATPAGAKDPWRETYCIEPLSAENLPSPFHHRHWQRAESGRVLHAPGNKESTAGERRAPQKGSGESCSQGKLNIIESILMIFADRIGSRSPSVGTGVDDVGGRGPCAQYISLKG
jgi:hypothetical protein